MNAGCRLITDAFRSALAYADEVTATLSQDFFLNLNAGVATCLTLFSLFCCKLWCSLKGQQLISALCSENLGVQTDRAGIRHIFSLA